MSRAVSTDTYASPLLAEGRHVAAPVQEFQDPFFYGQDVLKTYEIDYEAVAAFDADYAFSQLIGGLFFPPAIPFVLCGCCVFNSFTKPNIRDKARATHLALTRDGIKYVVDRHPTGCRLDCQEAGRVSKTVPYDKMTDCDVEEPAGSVGALCYLVPRTLTVVHVDTASSGFVAGPNGPPVEKHELEIRGVKDPDLFKRDVWAMKRGEPVDGVDGTVAPMAVSMHRGGGGGGDTPSACGGSLPLSSTLSDGKVLAPLLEEQTSLLKELLAAQQETNALLKASSI